LKDCPDNFLALDSNLHNQFDGRSVNPSGVPLFVIIPEEITSSTISSSVSSKIYTNVKVAIYFYNETVAPRIVPHFKHFENGPNDSVHMFLGASHPHLFVQCLNWKGVSQHSNIGFSPIFLFLLSAQRTLESWQDRSFLPSLIIPFDESVLSAVTPSPPLDSQPISSREDRHLLKKNKPWTPSPNPKLRRKAGRRSPPLPPAPSGQ